MLTKGSKRSQKTEELCYQQALVDSPSGFIKPDQKTLAPTSFSNSPNGFIRPVQNKL